ncbi:MAG: Ig-like domain-containing protein [Candidatus Dormibacteria bacterium]
MIARRLIVLTAAGGGLTLLAGCASPGVARVVVGTPNAVLVVAPPQVTVTPADHASGVALDTPVSVSSNVGNLTAVAVTRVGGAAVTGQLSADGRTWTASDGLDPGASYRVTVAAAGPGGTHTSTVTSFSTLGTVNGRLLTTSTPDDGATVGVGEPIDLHFNTSVPESLRAGVVEHLQVVSTPAQAGAWHWFSGSELHYRPAVYWQSGTTVTVTAKFHGVNAGNGIWGLASWSTSFTVGAKHVSLIDDTTHQMQVYTNDQLVDTWPVSLGKAGFRTLEGTLVVLYKTPKVMMDSCSTFGGAACHPGNVNYYHDYVYEDTAVSTNGFFIHAAPWSEPSQGSSDVSHGCVNLSTAHATTFFNYSLAGDVVVISHTGNVADYSNGEADWQIPFAQWDNTGVAQAAPSVPPAAPGGP